MSPRPNELLTNHYRQDSIANIFLLVLSNPYFLSLDSLKCRLMENFVKVTQERTVFIVQNKTMFTCWVHFTLSPTWDDSDSTALSCRDRKTVADHSVTNCLTQSGEENEKIYP